MSTVHSGLAGSIASQAQQTSSKTQSIQPMGKQTFGIQNPNMASRTKGSVFGSLTFGNKAAFGAPNKPMNGMTSPQAQVAAINTTFQANKSPQAQVQAIGADYRASAPQNQQQRTSQPNIGNLLNGNSRFGQMTTMGRPLPQQNFAAQQGLMTNPNIRQDNFNSEQARMKTDDQRLTEALGMDATNIMMEAA